MIQFHSINSKKLSNYSEQRGANDPTGCHRHAGGSGPAQAEACAEAEESQGGEGA